MINATTPTCIAAFHQYTPDGYLVFFIGHGQYLTMAPDEWRAINSSTDTQPHEAGRWVFDRSHDALVAGERPTHAARGNDAFHLVSQFHTACELDLVQVADASFYFAGPLSPPTWSWYIRNHRSIASLERRKTLAEEIAAYYGPYRPQ